MGQGFKVFSSSELSCKWPKVAETMTVADHRLPRADCPAPLDCGDGVALWVGWSRAIVNPFSLRWPGCYSDGVPPKE
jgi:hypothetical protein